MVFAGEGWDGMHRPADTSHTLFFRTMCHPSISPVGLIKVGIDQPDLRTIRPRAVTLAAIPGFTLIFEPRFA